MKISSRSILSPARSGSGRDPPLISLSNSHSRKLRNSRSIKGGGASPAMFPTAGRKRGSGFENPEPSSPKVTCIGQVRVKTKKKHAKNLRSLSRRRSSGEVSFRRLEHSGNGFGTQSENLGSNNQRWVHLPLTICEALKTLGSEVSCLFPCRNSCSSTTAMVAVQEGDGGGRDAGGDDVRREVELVAGDDDDDEMGVMNSRRHVFQDLEIVNDSVLGAIDEARVSTCVPPKNALLLMRFRSDPMKMEALTNRFWEPNLDKDEDEEEEETEMGLIEVSNQEHDDLQENSIDQETNQEMERKQSFEEDNNNKKQSIETNEEEEEEEESLFLWSLFEENTDQNQESEETEEKVEDFEDFEEENEKIDSTKSLPECLLLMMYEPKLSMEVSKETWVCSSDFIRRRSGRKPPPVPPPITGEEESKCQKVLQQPARFSMAMASKFDQKVAKTNGFEPLVLTRCKSEPLRAKIGPDSCFWKNKLEPPRRASFGIDVAGLGF